MLSNPADRRDLLREGRKAVATVFVMAVVIDAAWAQTSGLAEVRSIVDLANAKIETLSQGKGDVVVLLPGGSLSLDYLANLARSLETSGYRAVRINPRGAGASTGAAEGVTLHTLADDVAGVIEQLDGGPVWVAGHAFGNRVARMLASDHPELVKGV
ncbi:MAG: alpha/beta hydrolase, partial [Acidobacteriota bacterium]|nr:alpha/beta hydrolase [Acidobacteriota bacterium]